MSEFSLKQQAVVPTYSPVSDPVAETLGKLLVEREYSQNSVVFAQDTTPTQVVLLRSGVVKLSAIDDRGREMVVGLRSAGWWMGGTFALLDMPSPFTVTALTSCIGASLPANAFQKELLRNTKHLLHYLHAQSRELVSCLQHMVIREASAAQRIRQLESERLLLQRETIDPFSLLPRYDIAKLLSITPEHLSRVGKGAGKSRSREASKRFQPTRRPNMPHSAIRTRQPDAQTQVCSK